MSKNKLKVSVIAVLHNAAIAVLLAADDIQKHASRAEIVYPANEAQKYYAECARRFGNKYRHQDHGVTDHPVWGHKANAEKFINSDGFDFMMVILNMDIKQGFVSTPFLDCFEHASGAVLKFVLQHEKFEVDWINSNHLRVNFRDLYGDWNPVGIENLRVSDANAFLTLRATGNSDKFANITLLPRLEQVGITPLIFLMNDFNEEALDYIEEDDIEKEYFSLLERVDALLAHPSLNLFTPASNGWTVFDFLAIMLENETARNWMDVLFDAAVARTRQDLHSLLVWQIGVTFRKFNIHTMPGLPKSIRLQIVDYVLWKPALQIKKEKWRAVFVAGEYDTDAIAKWQMFYDAVNGRLRSLHKDAYNSITAA